MEPAKKKGAFAPIESKSDAERVTKDAAKAFWFIALLQAALAYFIGASLLIDAVLYLVLGGALWLWKSRVAAVLLLLLAAIGIVVTFLNNFAEKPQGGTNIFLSVIVAVVAFRAVQATFKLHGRFADEVVGSRTPTAPTAP